MLTLTQGIKVHHSYLIGIMVGEPPGAGNDELECLRQEMATRAGRPTAGKTTIESIMRVLAHPTRRFLLYYLRDEDVASVGDLATAIGAVQLDVPRTDIPDDHLERVKRELLHNHLPKLQQANFLEYDSRTKTIRFANPPKVLDKFLDLLTEIGREQ